ncbi:hypothetical protein RintRC_3285 [Richelia intracellularis]|nr:hypothetical protein RintRC_3285 [Richelia intracellularis]
MGFVLFSPFFLHLNIFLWSDIPTATTFSLFSPNPTYILDGVDKVYNEAEKFSSGQTL